MNGTLGNCDRLFWKNRKCIGCISRERCKPHFRPNLNKQNGYVADLLWIGISPCTDMNLLSLGHCFSLLLS